MAPEAVFRPVKPPVRLMRLSAKNNDPHPNAIGFALRDYLELVDWAGRAIRDDKRGYIPEQTPPILTRLGIAPAAYLNHINGHSAQRFPRLLGHAQRVKAVAARLGQRFVKGIRLAEALYPRPRV